jgi:hypothetical protein
MDNPSRRPYSLRGMKYSGDFNAQKHQIAAIVERKAKRIPPSLAAHPSGLSAWAPSVDPNPSQAKSITR